MAAFRASLDEKLNRKREETLAPAQEGEEKISPGKVALLILAALLPLPEAAAEQSPDETKKETEQAAA
jgi:hypothetical protein